MSPIISVCVCVKSFLGGDRRAEDQQEASGLLNTQFGGRTDVVTTAGERFIDVLRLLEGQGG